MPLLTRSCASVCVVRCCHHQSSRINVRMHDGWAHMMIIPIIVPPDSRKPPHRRTSKPPPPPPPSTHRMRMTSVSPRPVTTNRAISRVTSLQADWVIESTSVVTEARVERRRNERIIDSNEEPVRMRAPPDHEACADINVRACHKQKNTK
jgi:hypothetical protein